MKLVQNENDKTKPLDISIPDCLQIVIGFCERKQQRHATLYVNSRIPPHKSSRALLADRKR